MKYQGFYLHACKEKVKHPASKVSYTCSKIFDFFWGKFFWEVDFGHFFCPFLKKGKQSTPKFFFKTIIEFYGKVAKKSFFILLL
jgi:hypothetical protein